MSKIFKGETVNNEPAANWPAIQAECAKYHQFSIEVRNTNPKSRKQLGAHFGLALKTIIDELTNRGEDCSLIYNLPEPTGVKITSEMLHRFFDAMFPVKDEKGEPKTMRNFTTTETSLRFEQIRNWAAAQWQIRIPEPDPEYFKKEKV